MASYLDVVIPAFIAGKSKKSATLRSEAASENGTATLFSYETEIAFREQHNDGLVFFLVSTEKYSNTTSRQQNTLQYQLRENGYSPTEDTECRNVNTRRIFYQTSPTSPAQFEVWR